MKKKSSFSNNAALLKRLRSAGYPLLSARRRERPHDLIIEISQPELTVAYDCRAGVEYVFSVRVINRSYARLSVQRYGGVMPWRAHLLWPGDPRVYLPEREGYRLESGRTFPYGKVLNHRVRERGELQPGESMEGLLIAYTMFERISFNYLHGDMAQARLFVVDQFGRKHRSDLEILADRSATMQPLSLKPMGSGLYEDDGMGPVVFSQYVPGPVDSPRKKETTIGEEEKAAKKMSSAVN